MNMRDIIDIAEGVAYRDRGLCVFSSPTKLQVEKLLQKATSRKQDDYSNNEVRALLDRHSKQVFAWDGYFATHDDIARILGVSGYLPLTLLPSGVEMYWPNSPDEEETAILKADADLIKASALSRVYGAGLRVKINIDFKDILWL